MFSITVIALLSVRDFIFQFMDREKEILRVIGNIIDPETRTKISDIGELRVTVNKGHVGIILKVFTYRDKAWEQHFKTLCEKAIKDVMSDISSINVVLVCKRNPVQNKTEIKGVKNIIVVVSSKGGVGKSTVSANVALALCKMGYKTALVDADIYGPSIPSIIGTEVMAEVDDEGNIIPIESRCGMKSLSMANLLPDSGRAVIWRGPMLTKAINKLMLGTKWSDIDYMLIDTPPGTGDIHISLINSFVVNGALIVSTPHSLSIEQATKTCDMLKHLGVKVLGAVENMSYFSDPKTKDKQYIFGKGSVKELSATLGFPVLGEVEIDSRICRSFTGRDFEELDKDLCDLYKGIATGMLKSMGQL